MDTATTLEKYTQDISNLPLEIKHLLEEIKSKDQLIADARKRYLAKDHQIFKFIRQNGTLTKNSKEQYLYQKIEEDMKLVESLQSEKILLANSALYLISKNYFNLEKDIKVLENDELLPPLESLDIEVIKEEYNSSSYTPSPGIIPEMTQPQPPPVSTTSMPKKIKRKNLKSPEPMEAGSLMLNNGSGDKNGDDDNNLYCFCQRVSFGEMIGCDNENCKYEWFHWSCVGITSPPKDDEIWYCPDCSIKLKKKRSNK